MAMTKKAKTSYLPPEKLDELAVRAKEDKSAASQLWYEVERFVEMKLSKAYGWLKYKPSSVLDYDDYRQCVYFGFVNAVKYFNPEKGRFLTALDFGIRGACQSEQKRLRIDLQQSICSLDTKLYNSDGEEGGTLVDFLTDEAAEEAFENVIDESVVRVILNEAEKLSNPKMTQVIKDCVFGERTIDSFAGEHGISKQAASALKKNAIRHLRHKASVRALFY